MICPKCNHRLPDDSEFCQYCGNRIEKAETQQAEEALDTIIKFQAEQTVKNLEGNSQNQPDNERDADFGLVPEKPIYTLALKSVDGEIEYLNRLYTENGVKVGWERQGSMSVDGVSGMIDIYNTYLPSGEFYKTIYINMYGAKASQNAPKGFVFVKPEEKRTTPNNVIRNTPKTKPKKKNAFISFANISSIILASLSIVITIFVMAQGSQDDDFMACQFVSLTAYGVFLVFSIISLIKKRFKLLTGLSFVLCWVVGGFVSLALDGYSYYHSNYEIVEICSIICFIDAIIVFLIMLFPTSVAITNAIKNSWHQSVRYHEKCYKRIAKMHTYLEKGIISREEYEKVRKRIISKIRN